MIGTTADNTIWLVTVDGRQPELSVGMTLVELRALAHRLGLVNALNLDGGGSTTMWVQGQVVQPSIGIRLVRARSATRLLRSSRDRQETRATDHTDNTDKPAPTNTTLSVTMSTMKRWSR